MYGMREGNRGQGSDAPNKVCIFAGLMDSKSPYLTGNTSTLYARSFLDLKNDGPTVIEAPTGMLGVFNDMWFRYMSDIGPAGPTKARAASTSYCHLATPATCPAATSS